MGWAGVEGVQFKPPAGSADLQTTGFFHFFGGGRERKNEKKKIIFLSILFLRNESWPPGMQCRGPGRGGGAGKVTRRTGWGAVRVTGE